jgi:hypothetical protein
MSATKSEASTGIAEILPGVRHYETSGFANSWAVYDALTEEDGWKVGDAWKRGRINGRAVVVHAPTTHSCLDEATGEGRR